MNKVNIRELSAKELQNYASELGYEKFVGTQIFEWLHNKMETSFDKMTNLPQELREHLNNNFYIDYIKIKKKLVSNIDGTIKYLFELNDKECIETVLMKYKYGYSLCISTQVGCKMGCRFCASSMCEFSRNLTVSELLDQIILVYKDLNIKINNLVLMGMGEPLENLDNVVRFLKMLPSKYGINLSLRKVTLSTCGVVDKMYELMKHRLQLTLSVSLHASNDKIRDQIMPINKRWNIEQLLKASEDYFEYTRRRVSFEYALIKDLNDSPEHALELVNLFKNKICHINLIPLNNIKERNFVKSPDERVLQFQNILRKNEINVTIRRELGSDINAACGQLRRQDVEA